MTATSNRSAVDLARAYLEALQAKNKQDILSILSEDFALEIPCNISGTNDFSDSWRGLDTADANYEATFKMIDILKYADVEYTQGADCNIAFAEGLGVMRMANGRPYRNRYVFRFDTEGGKIKRIREYVNPITFAVAMRLPLPQADS